jgi:IS5 family transposase
LDSHHPFYELANAIKWERFETSFRPLYSEKKGAPAKPMPDGWIIDAQTHPQSV